jgi:glycosyltransferase involved in cell wall biosynthesis
MRLVHLGSPVGLPSEQAHSHQIVKMCEAFAAHGLDTCLLCPDPPESAEAMPAAQVLDLYGVKLCFEIRRLACWDARRLLAARFPRSWRGLRALSYSAHACLHVLRHWNDARTVVYSRDRFASYMLLLCAPRLRARHVFESHNFLAERRGALVVALLRRLDTLVVTTSFLARKYAAAGIPERRILVAPNGVDLDPFRIDESKPECRRRTALPPERPIVAYVGSFTNTMGMEKGVPELIRAQSLLVERMPQNPPLLLLVGGPAERVPEYRRLAERLGVAPQHCRFVGFVPRAEVPFWLRASDVLTVPWSWNEFSAYQTSPLKVREYMASGVPIVASDLPSLREVLSPDRNALLVPPGDPAAIAEACHRLLADPELGRRLAERALADVRDQTWRHRAARVLAVPDVAAR